MTPTPRSLVVDLLSTVGEHAMPVRALLAAGEVFSITPESIRVALVRLLERDTIERNERGQYRIAPAARAVHQHVVAWNRIEERVIPWRGAWVAVHTGGLPRADRAGLRRRERALEFLGFRVLEAGLWVRPDNLRGGVDGVRNELIELGLDNAAPVFLLSQLDAATDARARALWDAKRLRRSYRELITALQESGARLARLEPRAAMAESFTLGGEGIRHIVLDPLLPEPITPAEERAAVVEAMKVYDRLGRDLWRALMKEHGAPHLRVPLNRQALQPPRAAAVGGL